MKLSLFEIVACCVYAMACVVALSNLPSQYRHVQMQRNMKEDAASREAEAAASRRLVEGLETVHWRFVLDIPAGEALSDTTLCHQSHDQARDLPHFMRRGAQVVAHHFMTEYSQLHNIPISELSWEIGSPSLTVTEHSVNDDRSINRYVFEASAKCPFCNPANFLATAENGRRLGDTTDMHPKYLSGIISRLLKNQIKTFCVPNLQQFVFEMAEEAER